MISKVNFSNLTNNIFVTSSKKENKDPILKAIEKILLSKTIAKKELKGESLSKKEQEFKENNIVIPDADTILLTMLETKDSNLYNSNRLNLKDKTKDKNILKLKEFIK